MNKEFKSELNKKISDLMKKKLNNDHIASRILLKSFFANLLDGTGFANDLLGKHPTNKLKKQPMSTPQKSKPAKRKNDGVT